MNPGRFALHQRVLVNLAVGLVVIAGVVAALRLPREVFPSFSQDKLAITTLWPGASPGEVELLVTAKIEEQLENLTGVDEIRSNSAEGLSSIQVDLTDTAPEMGRMIDDVKAAIDAIDDFPQEIEEPTIQELKTRFPVINAVLFGDLDPGFMHDLAEEVERDLRRIEGVAQVVLAGSSERILWVEPDQDRLQEFGLSVQDLALALRARNLNSPGGQLFGDRGAILVRTLGEFEGAEDLEALPLRPGRDGTQLTLGRVARVREGFEDPPRTLAFVEGRPALTMTVFKDETGDAIHISQAVRDYAAEQRHTLPSGVDLRTNGDFSVFIENRLRTMNSTGILALFLVLACLSLFLSTRIAFLTAVGIPVAFLGTLAALSLFGGSLSMVAMFAFIIVIGMVVDDAIVLCENVYRHLEAGANPWDAAIQGTREVAAPVLCTVTTTIAAFLPMTMISGEIGKYIVVIPVVVSLALLFSLFEALFALPVHVYELMYVTRRWKLSQAPLAGFMDWLSNGYARVVGPLLRWRHLTLATLFGGSLVIVAVGLSTLKFELFGEIETKQFFINFESAPSTRIEEMAARVRPAEQAVAALPPEELETYNTNVGIVFQDISRSNLGPHLAQVFVDLREGGERTRDSEAIIQDVRQRVDGLPGIRKVQVTRPAAGPNVPAIELGVEGDDLEAVQAAAEELVTALSGLDGVHDVRTDTEAGKEELRLTLSPTAELLGLTVEVLAREVRQRFLYAEASRVHRTQDAPEIRVRLPEHQRTSEEQVLSTWLTLPDGTRSPLRDLVVVERERGPSQISRTDQVRTVTVWADVDRQRANPKEVIDEVRPGFPALAARHGVAIQVKGESLEMDKSVEDLVMAMLISLGTIYVLLAALFRSYFQPLIVMLVIPFAVDGVVVGHLVGNASLTFLSMMGFVALAGVVVNDSLVLVSFINQRRREGAELMDAVLEGGRLRLRPILLTSITTIVGLVPLAFFATGQARFLSPMALSIVWGLAFATALTLIVVPCLYLALEDLRRVVVRWTGGPVQRVLGAPSASPESSSDSP